MGVSLARGADNGISMIRLKDWCFTYLIYCSNFRLFDHLCVNTKIIVMFVTLFCKACKLNNILTYVMIKNNWCKKKDSYRRERNDNPFSQNKKARKPKHVTKYHSCLSSYIVYHHSFSVIFHFLALPIFCHSLLTIVCTF